MWFAVKVLEALGQFQTARRLKLAHIAWAAHNSDKTDRNLFFTTKVRACVGVVVFKVGGFCDVRSWQATMQNISHNIKHNIRAHNVLNL